MDRIKKWKYSEYFGSDITAALLGTVLFAALLLTAKYGVGMSDEGYYYTVTHRLILGEHMIADEWNLAQLVHLLNFIPNFAFIKLTGGTEGLILFMRYLFVFIVAVFYCFIYIKLRSRKLWGAAAAFLFSAVIQQILLTIAYFTAAPMAFLAVWLMLASDEKKLSPPKLLLTGLILACGILAEPFLIVLYAAWFVFTVIREKAAAKNSPLMNSCDFLLSKKKFIWVTLGAVAMFVPYMLYLFLSGSFEGIGAAIPYLSSGAEYNRDNIIDLGKFTLASELYSIPVLALLAVFSVSAVIFRLKKTENERIRRGLFLGASLTLSAGYIYAGARLLSSSDEMLWVSFTQYNNLLLLIYSAVPFMLSKKTNPKLLVLWAAGLLYSLLVDISSTVILASGGGLIRVACVLQFSDLIPELTNEKQTKKTKKVSEKKKRSPAVIAILMLCAAAAVAWNMGYFACATVYKPVEKLFLKSQEPLSHEIEKGPFKGLITNETIASIYNDTLYDLDEVIKTADKKPVTVLDLAPYTYLYMDLPYGSYSAWYEFDEPYRLAAYWGLRPEQRPAVIYIPFYNKNEFLPHTEEYLDEKLEGLMQYVQGSVERGKAGYILKVQSIRTSENGEWQNVN